MSEGKIITFYSYKGGTGRSMALANVAWILASAGKRVLIVDWDLEAPGLNKYFVPFLADPDLSRSDGIIDLVIDYALESAETAVAKAASGQTRHSAKDSSVKTKKRVEPWYISRANILRFATPIVWEFPSGGRIDFVPAGRQGPSYAMRVNSFEWRVFYEKLDGGAFLDAVTASMRSKYDYVLIDSRTGVSDTSGICTIQMPDALVACFTLNNQSVDGVAAVASSAMSQRSSTKGARPLQIWPVPTRIELAEKGTAGCRAESGAGIVRPASEAPGY
jgi:hypothetical protein